MKTSPANGSARSTCCTSAASPSMPFLKSTGLAASRIPAPRGGPQPPQPPPPPQHPPQRRAIHVGADPYHDRPERDLHPPRGLWGRRPVLGQQHRHEHLLAECHGRRRAPLQLLPPGEQLARVQPVAPGHRRGGRGRVQALGHDPGLVLVRPAPAPADAGDHLEPAEAVGVRTIRTTMVTHRSRPVPLSPGPSSSPSSAGPQGARQTTLTTIITAAANELVRPVHERMPLILFPALF